MVGELSPAPAMNRNNDVGKCNSDRFFLRGVVIADLICRLQPILFYEKNIVAGAGDSSPTMRQMNFFKG